MGVSGRARPPMLRRRLAVSVARMMLWQAASTAPVSPGKLVRSVSLHELYGDKYTLSMLLIVCGCLQVLRFTCLFSRPFHEIYAFCSCEYLVWGLCSSHGVTRGPTICQETIGWFNVEAAPKVDNRRDCPFWWSRSKRYPPATAAPAHRNPLYSCSGLAQGY